jgi:hypothetical protein
MLNRFAVFLFGASLLCGTIMAQNGQPPAPPASQNPPPAQANQPSPQPQQQDSPTAPVADPGKALQPRQEPEHWKKIKVVPDKKPKAIPAGTFDVGTPA